jgi:hypothetical protein
MGTCHGARLLDWCTSTCCVPVMQVRMSCHQTNIGYCKGHFHLSHGLPICPYFLSTCFSSVLSVKAYAKTESKTCHMYHGFALCRTKLLVAVFGPVRPYQPAQVQILPLSFALHSSSFCSAVKSTTVVSILISFVTYT